jgi:hypothetical protein
MRVLLGEIAHARDRRKMGLDEDEITPMMVMGDDANERFSETIGAEYGNLGFKVKDTRLAAPGCFDFCSTLWKNDWRGQPANQWRTVYRFLSHSVSDASFNEWRVQLGYDLRHSPDSEQILARVDQWTSERLHTN